MAYPLTRISITYIYIALAYFFPSFFCFIMVFFFFLCVTRKDPRDGQEVRVTFPIQTSAAKRETQMFFITNENVIIMLLFLFYFVTS